VTLYEETRGSLMVENAFAPPEYRLLSMRSSSPAQGVLERVLEGCMVGGGVARHSSGNFKREAPSNGLDN